MAERYDSFSRIIGGIKAAFHDTDKHTDTDTDILATILARMSVSWNAALMLQATLSSAIP